MSTDSSVEFDQVAAWTAEVALDLGPEFCVPAACRGSGSPAALDWLIDRLRIGAADRMLDCGAGVGGPGRYAEQRCGVRPVLVDPAAGACRAASMLFTLPVVQADALRLPFADATFDVAWCLGVVSTVEDQDVLLVELRRVLRPSGRLGLLEYVTHSAHAGLPVGTRFPTRARLVDAVTRAGFVLGDVISVDALGDRSPFFDEHSDRVDAELQRRHATDPVWRRARAQAETVGDLIADGSISAHVLTAT